MPGTASPVFRTPTIPNIFLPPTSSAPLLSSDPCDFVAGIPTTPNPHAGNAACAGVAYSVVGELQQAHSNPVRRLPQLTPYTRFACSSYDFASNLSVTAKVDNLFDKMPPNDPTHTAWPYYDFGAYNPYGRSYFIDLDLHL